VFQNARLRSGDGQFDSEKDAAVGKTDCTSMLKLVPFACRTGAGKLTPVSRVGRDQKQCMKCCFGVDRHHRGRVKTKSHLTQDGSC
jgi:hypothetical protein